MAAPESLLAQLQARGDLIAVEKGRVAITAASGRPVPREWLEQNRRRLLVEAAQTENTLVLEYVGFSVGNYGLRHCGGVTLQFCCMATKQEYYAIFNAETRRQRTTKYGKKGDPLPKGHFIVGKRSAFNRFWESTGLAMHRLSDFHDYMGNLASLAYTAHIERGERLDAQTLRPLSLIAPDKRPTTPRQAPDNAPTCIPDKEAQQSQQPRAFQANQSTGQEKYGSTVTREHGHTGRITPPESQSVDEWLEDHRRG